MIDDEITDDITEDLTIDGADLLAELQAEHARKAAEVADDELSVDGRELLAEIRSEAEKWKPVPELPPVEALATVRAGGPAPIQIAVIGVVALVALAIGGWLIYGIVS